MPPKAGPLSVVTATGSAASVPQSARQVWSGSPVDTGLPRATRALPRTRSPGNLGSSGLVRVGAHGSSMPAAGALRSQPRVRRRPAAAIAGLLWQALTSTNTEPCIHAGYSGPGVIPHAKDTDPSAISVHQRRNPRVGTAPRPRYSLQIVTTLDGSVFVFVGLGPCLPFPRAAGPPRTQPPPRTSERTSHDRAQCFPAAAPLELFVAAYVATATPAAVTAASVLGVAALPAALAAPWREGAAVLAPAGRLGRRLTPQILGRPNRASRQSPACSRTWDHCLPPGFRANASSAAASVKYLISSPLPASGNRATAPVPPGEHIPGPPSAFFPFTIGHRDGITGSGRPCQPQSNRDNPGGRNRPWLTASLR
jgi:hypothetical protein